MKIAFLLSRIEQTGVTTHTLDLAQGLVEDGHQVCLITGGKIENATSRVDDFYNEFKALGVQIEEFKTPKGNRIKRAMESVTSVLAIMSKIRRFKPNVIHCQSPYMTFIPWLMGKKFTTTLHILYLKRNFKFKKPDHLIAISNESYEFSKKVFGMEDRNLSLIHHGVSDRFAHSISPRQKSDLKNRLNITEDKLVIGFVGSISLRKGSDILVQALNDLSTATKENIHFIFLGGVEGSVDFDWLKKMVESAGIQNFMTMVPFEDPKPFYDIFDIFVLPSRMESFPLVTLEAMMSECCPVRSNTEGAYEQIEDGVNGLLFENENIHQFTSILEKLVSDPDLRKLLAKNAKTKALNKFTIPVMTKKTLEVYSKIHMN